MKKIECECGYEIYNKTDNLPFKARYIPDTLWDSFWDLIDYAIEKTGNDPVKKDIACMSLRNLNYFRDIFQCSNCARIYIEDESYQIHLASETTQKHMFRFRIETQKPEEHISEARKKRRT